MTAKLEIIPLDFDSQLFGYPVGKYDASDYWDDEAFKLAAKPYQLSYIFSAKPLDTTDPDIILVDEKVTFTKDLTKHTPQKTHNHITETWQQDLEDLALESGKYSRFKADKRLQNGEFEKLYKYWIKKAFEQKEVIIEGQEGRIKGMVTVETNIPTAKIGLIAVDSIHRGQGVAQKLLHAATQHAHSKGCHHLQVSTQANNIPACNLYQNAGFALVDSDYIYHYYNC
jgi:dTDP-4-amino-4,6-dideoxy-D-galactose acyltransferase